MSGPGVQPLFLPNGPEVNIIFQLVALVCVQRRQGRTQVALHGLGLKIGVRRLQGRNHGGDDALPQNILGSRPIQWNSHTPEDHLRRTGVARHIRHHQGDVPVAAAPADQPPRLHCRRHGLLPDILRPVGAQHIPGRSNRKRALKQPLPGQGQRLLPALQAVHLHRDAPTLGNAKKLPGGLAGLLKGQQGRIHLITVQRHGNHGAGADQLLQDGQILPGEVRKAVYVKDMVLAIVAFLQLLQQPAHLIPGVPSALGAEAVIALHEQSQLLQLLGKASRGPGRSLLQVIRRNAAALEFVHRIHQLLKKLRLAFQGGIGFQPAGQLPGRSRHSHHPAAVIQAVQAGAAHLFRYGPAQPGERQHLCIPAGRIPGSGTESPLHLMADELRHNEHISLLPGSHVLTDLRQNFSAKGLPVLPQKQSKHSWAPFCFRLPFQGNVINLRQACLFFVGAAAHIGPKGSVFDPFRLIGKACNWRFPLHEMLTFVGCGPMRASAPTVKSLS